MNELSDEVALFLHVPTKKLKYDEYFFSCKDCDEEFETIVQLNVHMCEQKRLRRQNLIYQQLGG